MMITLKTEPKGNRLAWQEGIGESPKRSEWTAVPLENHISRGRILGVKVLLYARQNGRFKRHRSGDDLGKPARERRFPSNDFADRQVKIGSPMAQIRVQSCFACKTFASVFNALMQIAGHAGTCPHCL